MQSSPMGSRVTGTMFFGLSDLLLPLEEVFRQQFIPALSGQPPPSDVVRALLVITACLGGFGLANPTTVSNSPL